MTFHLQSDWQEYVKFIKSSICDKFCFFSLFSWRYFTDICDSTNFRAVWRLLTLHKCRKVVCPPHSDLTTGKSSVDKPRVSFTCLSAGHIRMSLSSANTLSAGPHLRIYIYITYFIYLLHIICNATTIFKAKSSCIVHLESNWVIFLLLLSATKLNNHFPEDKAQKFTHTPFLWQLFRHFLCFFECSPPLALINECRAALISFCRSLLLNIHLPLKAVKSNTEPAARENGTFIFFLIIPLSAPFSLQVKQLVRYAGGLPRYSARLEGWCVIFAEHVIAKLAGEGLSQCDCWRVERLTDVLAGVSVLKLRCGHCVPMSWIFNEPL